MIDSRVKALGLSLLLALAPAVHAQEADDTDKGEATRQEIVQQDVKAEQNTSDQAAQEKEEKPETADRFEPTEQINEDYSIDFPIDI